MRSSFPMPNNPWPHDMAIGVDFPQHLTILLFVREAWGIDADAEVPDLDPLPGVGGSRLPDSTTAA